MVFGGVQFEEATFGAVCFGWTVVQFVRDVVLTVPVLAFLEAPFQAFAESGERFDSEDSSDGFEAAKLVKSLVGFACVWLHIVVVWESVSR